MSAIDVQNINSKTGSSAITIADSGDISLSASITFDTDTLYVDASNNRVGIGTTSPSDKLHVYSGASGGSPHSYTQLLVENSTHNAIQIISPDTSEQAIWFGDASSSTAGGITYYHPTNHMTFRSNDTERMRIDSSGNVGIGTTSPSYKLEVVGQTHTDTLLVDTFGGVNSGFLGGRSDWTGGATDNSFAIGSYQSNICFFTNNSATERMRIDASGNVGIGGSPTAFGGGYIVSQVTGSPGAYSLQSAGGVVAQHAADSGVGGGLTGTRTNHPHVFVTNNTERMRINAAGGVYLGTTGTSIASGNLVVNEGVYVGAANGNNQIRSSSSGGGSATLYIGNAAIQVSSDRRLKENIIDTSMSALDKLDQVRVVDFTWNDPNDTAVNNRNARGTWTGIIAQELVDVFPFAVNAPRNEDDLSIDEKSESTWHVDQDQLVPVLIKAIQELKAEVAALKGSA